MLMKKAQMILSILLMLTMGYAVDCPADTCYIIDSRVQLSDGSPNPTHGQEIATGLCSCLDISSSVDFSDTTLTLTILIVDNEPIRAVEVEIYDNAQGLLEYSGTVEKGEKLLNVTDDVGAPKQMTLMANQLDDCVKVLAYSTARAQTNGDGQEGALFTIKYNVPGGLASLPDSIAFNFGLCNVPGTSMAPEVLNVACSFPDSLNPVAIQIILSAEEEKSIPLEFELAQNYPNPFNPSTRISFAVPELSNVRLNIYNVLGQTVNTLVDKQINAGRYEVEWNGLDARGLQVASGVYFYELKANDFSVRKKMLFLR